MNAEEIYAAVVTEAMAPSDAGAELRKLGYDAEDAREQISIVLGGDDVIYKDANGVERFLASNKTVEEMKERWDRKFTTHRRDIRIIRRDGREQSNKP